MDIQAVIKQIAEKGKISIEEAEKQLDVFFLKKPIYKDHQWICPNCGEVLGSEGYNNLCPEALAGSAGVIYKCPKCGYWYDDVRVMS